MGGVTEGYDEELSSYEEFPFAYEVEVYVLEGGGGVGVMDLGHGRVSVVVQGVTHSVAARADGGMRGHFN